MYQSSPSLPSPTPLSQYTFEKMGRADSVTAYDSEYETMSEQLDAIKTSTERIISFVQNMVQPHPGPNAILFLFPYLLFSTYVLLPSSSFSSFSFSSSHSSSLLPTPSLSLPFSPPCPLSP